VTLDGQGADEQLTGYLYYYAFFLYSLSIKDFLRELYYCSKVPGAGPYVRRGAIAFIVKCFFGKRATSFLIKKIFGRKVPSNLNEVLNRDFSTGLVNLFNNADRASMAHSVESRMPYVDYRLVEFLASVPASYKIHKGWSKYIARRAFSGKLPDEICWRKDKMGWPIPEDVWFKNDLKEWIQEQCSNKAKFGRIFPNHDVVEYNSNTKRLMLRQLNFLASQKRFGTKVVDR
jgi:asparagine synthase (glutamine-hydrolysing)